jgi:hypothetical protein
MMRISLLAERLKKAPDFFVKYRKDKKSLLSPTSHKDGGALEEAFSMPPCYSTSLMSYILYQKKFHPAQI